jgi:hypothetical protein
VFHGHLPAALHFVRSTRFAPRRKRGKRGFLASVSTEKARWKVSQITFSEKKPSCVRIAYEA